VSYFEQESYLQYLKDHCGPETRERVVGTGFARTVLDRLAITPTARVLEIGCGLGRILELMERAYGVQAHGCDISGPVVEEARRALPAAADRIVVCPGHDVPHPGGAFTHVIFWGVFEMTRQVPTLVEVSRLLALGGRALLCGVKPAGFRDDDADSREARRAYLEKGVPITYTDIPAFERALAYLGFAVRERLVFGRKRDVTEERFELHTASWEGAASDIYYIVEKAERTPLDADLQMRADDPRVCEMPT
jgi:SAM-dependent methyltransferase